MNAQTFFTLLAAAMVKDPPRAADAPIVARLASIGVVAGKPFDPSALGGDGRAQVELGVHDAFAQIGGYDPPTVAHVNGWRWTKDTGRFGTAYLYRAFIANTLLAANLPEDAVYPETSVDASGTPLSGLRRYTIHFGAANAPPANAFWSLTALRCRSLPGSELDRPLHAARHQPEAKPRTVRSTSRSQHDAPPGDQTNWLPAPAGPFLVTLRLYWPQPNGLDGTYRVPPLVPSR